MTWPAVDGTVQSISFGERTDPNSRHLQKLHCLNVKYEYKVQGNAFSDLKELESDRSESTIKLRALELESKPIVKVHFNPKCPSESYISHGGQEAPLPVLFTIAAFALLCTVWQFLALIGSILFRQSDMP